MDNANNGSIQRQLWKREAPGAPYIDWFASLDDEFRTTVADLLCRAQKEQIDKNDTVASRLLKLGDRQCRKRNWQEATELYNRCVRTAENGSLNLLAAYKSRSNCFAMRGMDEKASIDMNLSGEPPTKLAKRRSDRLQHRKMSITSGSERTFNPNKKFPSLANALEVQHNLKFGRHIVATCDIGVGQTIAMDRHFAGIICTYNQGSTEQAYCITCHRTDANFMPCPNCTSAMFCSHSCYQANDTHQFECQSIFHELVSTTVKLAIQLVFIAMKNFPNVNDLIAFVDDILNKSSNNPNNLANTAFPSYGLLLKLQCSSRKSDIKRTYEAFEFLMTLPTIQCYFDSIANQRFLMHLLMHHFGIIRQNGFYDIFGWTQNLHCKYIFTSMSLINHG